MTVTVTSALAGPATARYSNVYGALVDLGVLSGLGAQDVTGSGDPVAPILNAAGFYAPLTHSLVLTRGTGNPTYTRATAAWEFDNEGKLITVPSGAARFGGARMVRNLALNSTDFSNATWSKAGGITVVSDLITTTLTQANAVSPVTAYSFVLGNIYTVALSVKAGSKSVFQICVPSAVTGSSLRANFDASNGQLGTLSAGISGTIGADPDNAGYYRCTATFTATITVNQPLYFTVQDSTGAVYYASSTAGTICVKNIQLENVTGQADQTASEYVSVGVLSAPYHGAGVDGVKYFNTNKNGSAISSANLLGYHAEGARTNNLLYSRDLTNAAWVVTNITPVKTATGIDGAPNSATTLTAGAADATILQTLTLAAAARSSSAYVKRRTGTGNVYMTRDGGTNWTDITASLGASWTRVKIENTSVLNPSIGFKIATSGDAIDVDCVQDEAGAKITSPIITTTAAVTRNADAHTDPTASNWSDTAGWALATVYSPDWSSVAGGIIGSATNGLLPLTTNTGAKAYDGTNTVNGPAGAPSGTVKAAMTWGGGALQVAANGTAGTAGSYDGAWGLASIGIGTSTDSMYIKNVYIAQTALTDAQLQQVTS